MTESRNRGLLSAVILVGAMVLLAGCDDYPPMKAQQDGFRGTGMEQVINPRMLAMLRAENQLPEEIEPLEPEGPPVSEIYENVPLLGSLTEGEFLRIMTAITEWVSPEEGCAYCHTDNLADDSVYTKVVARRMLQMTKDINMNWQNHVSTTGVTCYTCHRGKPVPEYVWHAEPGPRQAGGMTASRARQNIAKATVGQTSLPFDAFWKYLYEGDDIRVIPTHALPRSHQPDIKQTEETYGLMMHMSDALGANCTFCHNSRSFFSWDQSSPRRVAAWHGIRMAQEINRTYIEPLRPVFPPNRLGPLGDTLKANCATCHQGVHKPLFGAEMLKQYPELNAVR